MVKTKDKLKTNPLTPEKERANFILDRAAKMKTAKDEYSQNWETYEKIWKMVVEEKTGEDSWRSALCDTWLFATIKTAQAAFADSKVAPIFTRHEDDDLTKARDLTDLYIDIAEKGEIDMELYYTRLDAFKLGMGFLETIYVEDKRNVQSIVSFDPETNTIKYEKKEIKDFDDPKTMRVSPYMMLVDEITTADFANTARDCIKIQVMPRAEAERKYPDAKWDLIPSVGGVNIAKEAVAKTSVAQTTGNIKPDEVETFRFFAPFELADDMVELLHYWSKNQGFDGTDTYEIVCNGEPIKVDTEKKPSPIPYIHKQLPFTPIPYSPYSGDEFWAAGIIEIGLTDAMNIVKNRERTNDRQVVSLFAPIIVDERTEIDQRQLRLKPLSIITARGGNFKQLQIPGATNADFMLQDRDAESLKRAVGIDERVLGMSPEDVRLTATEISFIREAALRRLREFASMLYKRGILREVKLKLSLFKQYFASPLVAEDRIKNDKGVKILKTIAKKYKIKSDNIYKEGSVKPNFFEGDIDVDIDMKIFLPLTQGEMIAKWSQVLRDSVPFIQAGLIDVDIKKIYEKYIDAMDVDINTLRRNDEGEAITMAEGEHKLLANHNTSSMMIEKIYKNGTPDQFLTAIHLKRHQELLQSDDKIEEAELRNVAIHMAKDIKNFQIKMQKEREMNMQALNNPLIGQIGGIAQGQPIQPMQLQQIPQKQQKPALPAINEGQQAI